MRVVAAFRLGGKFSSGYQVALLAGCLLLASPFTATFALAEAEHPYLTEKHLITLGGLPAAKQSEFNGSAEEF